MQHWNHRVRAAGLHLVIGLGTAALAATLVFGVWYPPIRIAIFPAAAICPFF